MTDRKKQVRWMNDYADWSCSILFEKREYADSMAHKHRIGVIRREWTEGQEPEYFKETV